MRCKHCEYRLWNLRSRQCPECGAPFRPSEFEFVPNTVQFRCPHCDQPYFGTGPKGHLDPYEFLCVTCHQRINMDEMVLLPTEGLEEEQTETGRMPWLQRSRIGMIRGWFGTVTQSMVHPLRLMRAMPVQSSTFEALWFATITNFIYYSIGLVWLVLFVMAVASAMAPGGGRGFTLYSLSRFTCFSIAAALLSAVVVVVWGFITHMLLALTGRTHAGPGRTLQAVGYSTGANCLTCFPCIGWYFGWIWWVVAAVLTVMEAQRVSGGRAALAVLTFPALVIGGLIALFAYSVAAFPAPTAGSTMAPTITMASTQTVLDAVINHAKSHNGQGPTHIAELVASNNLSSFDLCSSLNFATSQPADIADVSVTRFEMLGDSEQQQKLSAAIAALPPNLVAYRVGDTVFTYPGIDFRSADPGLWVVVRVVAVGTAATGQIVVGQADGQVVNYFGSIPSTVLDAQNQLRANANLPPLPDPTTVTCDAPATATTSP